MYDLSNGGVDLAPTRDHIPEDVLKVVEDAKAAIIAGEKSVPQTVADCPDFILN
jgi:basic membrane protein A